MTSRIRSSRISASLNLGSVVIFETRTKGTCRESSDPCLRATEFLCSPGSNELCSSNESQSRGTFHGVVIAQEPETVGRGAVKFMYALCC